MRSWQEISSGRERENKRVVQLDTLTVAQDWHLGTRGGGRVGPAVLGCNRVGRVARPRTDVVLYRVVQCQVRWQLYKLTVVIGGGCLGRGWPKHMVLWWGRDRRWWRGQRQTGPTRARYHWTRPVGEHGGLVGDCVVVQVVRIASTTSGSCAVTVVTVHGTASVLLASVTSMYRLQGAKPRVQIMEARSLVRHLLPALEHRSKDVVGAVGGTWQQLSRSYHLNHLGVAVA